LLNSYDKEGTLDDPVEIQKWSCFEVVEQPEPDPEPKERAMTF